MAYCMGIDFGNESLIVAVPKRGPFGLTIEVLQNEVGSRKTPAIIGYGEKQRYFGEEANSLAMGNAANTVTSVKRFLGRLPNDPELAQEQKHITCKLGQRDGRLAFDVEFEGKQELLLPEQVAATLLSRAKQIAEQGLDGQRVADCVIAVPAWWNDAQRRAIVDAAHLAGLNVLRLLSENTCVALNYHIYRLLKMEPKDRENAPEIKVMFYDMGHTNTNVSIVQFNGTNLKVLAHAADRNLGGRDFDYALMEHFAEYIKEKYKLDVMSNTKARMKLRKECVKVKHVLSANTRAPFSVEYIMNDTDVAGSITREEFEARIQQTLLSRVVAPIQKALAMANLKKEDLFAIEVIGGGIRVPSVVRAIEEFFGRPVSRTCDGDESIARGATWMAALLSPRFTIALEPQVKDLYPYPVQVGWGDVGSPAPTLGPDGQVHFATESDRLFSENGTNIPATKTITFNRTDSFQIVTAYPGVHPDGLQAINPVLARFVVTNIPKPTPPPAEIPEGIKLNPPYITVRLRLNPSGIICSTGAEFVEDRIVDAPPEPKQEAPKAEAAKAEAPKTEAKAEAGKQEAPKQDANANADNGAKPMDTSEDEAKQQQQQQAPPAPPKKIKKTFKIECKVEEYNTSGLDQKTYQYCFEREGQMAAIDKAVMETNLARNNLESYVLDMRSKMNGELAEFATPQEAESFLKQLDDIEMWLYDAGADAQKSEYKAKLEALQAIGNPIVTRRDEFLNRDETVAHLKSTIGRLTQLANSTEEKHSHIPPEERKKILDQLASADQWLAEALSKQDKVGKTGAPAVFCADIRKKATELETFANGIMSKPKPAPPKEEAKKPEAAKQEAPKQEASKKEQSKQEANGQQQQADPNGAAKMDTSA